MADKPTMKNPIKELTSEDVKKLFREFWNFSGEVSRQGLYTRVILLAVLALPSPLLVLIPLIGPLYVLALIVALAATVVQRLRHMDMAWWLVFFLALPGAGWLILGFLLSLKGSKNTEADGFTWAHRAVIVVSVVLVSTVLAIALVVNSESRDDDSDNEAVRETSQSVDDDEASEPEPPEDEQEEDKASEPDTDESSNSQMQDEPGPQQAIDAEFASLLGGLRVEPENPAGYDRDLFRHWTDADGDGCDTRREVLIAESVTPVTVGSGCSLTGGTWVSAFDGVETTDPSSFDVDHFVPLSEAWASGARNWDANTRERFANDLAYEMSLIAVSASSNRSKSDSDPSEWTPPASEYKCEYVFAWVNVKSRWNLSVDNGELMAIESAWTGCSISELDFSATAVSASVTEQEPEPEPEPTPEPAPEPNPEPTPEAELDPRFGSCTEARANGYSDYVAGVDPEYEWYQDRDKDGVVCETTS